MVQQFGGFGVHVCIQLTELFVLAFTELIIFTMPSRTISSSFRSVLFEPIVFAVRDSVNDEMDGITFR